MKTLNIPFEDGEHQNLARLKGDKLSWRDFILLMYVHCLDSKKRGNFEVIKK